ncbi:MAG: DUF883 family protein [Burkholderiales bacterium]|nr:DUF883 family protein [Burkholderiales bacterium]
MSTAPDTPDGATASRLADDLEAVARSAEALIAATAGQSGEAVRELRAKAEATLKSARDSLSAAGFEARLRAREAARATDDYVHAHPWTAIGAAAAVGVVLGMLIARR